MLCTNHAMFMKTLCYRYKLGSTLTYRSNRHYEMQCEKSLPAWAVSLRTVPYYVRHSVAALSCRVSHHRLYKVLQTCDFTRWHGNAGDVTYFIRENYKHSEYFLHKIFFDVNHTYRPIVMFSVSSSHYSITGGCPLTPLGKATHPSLFFLSL